MSETSWTLAGTRRKELAVLSQPVDYKVQISPLKAMEIFMFKPLYAISVRLPLNSQNLAKRAKKVWALVCTYCDWQRTGVGFGSLTLNPTCSLIRAV